MHVYLLQSVQERVIRHESRSTMTLASKSLFGVVHPYENETLASIVARAADVNVYRNLVAFLGLAGIEIAKPGYLATTQPSCTSSLASLLGMSETTLLHRVHRECGPERPSSVDWYGTPMPRKFIGAGTYRFSPTALASGAYQRSNWTLRPLTFCAETFEKLLDRCPHCDRLQQWYYRSAMDRCEKCRGDLKSAKTERLPSEFRSGLSEIVPLVDQSPSLRLIALKSFPGPFAKWEAGEVFSAIVESGALLHDTTSNRLVGKIKNGAFDLFTPSHLADGLAFIKAWPQSLESMLDRALDIESSCDLTICLGQVSRYFKPTSTDTKFRQVIREQCKIVLQKIKPIAVSSRKVRAAWINSNGAINQREACARFGTNAKTLRRLETKSESDSRARCAMGLHLYNPKLLEHSITLLKRSLDSFDVSHELGVPEFCIEALAGRKLVTKLRDTDAVTMAQKPLYEQESVNGILGSVGSLSSGSAEKTLTLSALLRHRFNPEDWADVIEAIVRRHIVAFRGTNCRNLRVDRVTATSFLEKMPRRSAPANLLVSCRTAAQLLEISEAVMLTLVKARRLHIAQRDGNRGLIRLSDIAAFDQLYFSSVEAKREYGIDSRKFARLMRGVGHAPLPENVRTTFWYREAATSLLKHILSKGSSARKLSN